MSAALMRAMRCGCALLLFLSVISCGGGGNSLGSSTPPVTPAANVVAVVVNGGPSELTALSVNTLYTTVTVCVPGSTTECQTIDNIQVDTGSSGLRLLAPALTLSLPVTATTSGASLLECMVFVDGYSWGPVSRVDLQVSGESANSVPVQLIGDPRFPNVPSDCSSTGVTAEDTVAAFGANGIIGIGPLVQDCGPTCATIAVPAFYYSCTPAACQNATVALTSQVPNPVTMFTTDNNGAIIVLPSVAADGAASVAGSLIFGIDTESNNQLGTATVFAINPTNGYLTTVFNSQTLTLSFVDSGSSAIYFNDPNIEPCSSSGFTGLYCPASPQTLSAALQGQNASGASTGTSIPESFTIASAKMQAQAEPTFTAIPELGGTNPMPGSFDWGVPFFYGRRIAVAIQGYTTSAGSGPFVAL